MIDLLAQGAPTIPAADYWQTWGVLGITFMCVLAAAVAWFWLVWLPDRRTRSSLEQKRMELEMQSDHSERQLEIAAKEKTLKVVDMLTDTIPAIVTTQQEIVHSQRKLAEVADRMDLRQQPHAVECKRTNEQVELIARHLKVIT